MTTRIDELVDDRRVVICCGSGGVGKTTTAAVLALEGARRGRSACVVTIDPARRLADALGIQHLTNDPTEIDRKLWADDTVAPGGRLFAMMLDTKSTFDVLVSRNASSPQQAQRILDNTFYRNVSGALGGTQEYMAMEKLHELYDEGNFDLIVVDTPPTRHALDFLDAPRRLTRLLDNRVFRLLMMPTRAYLKVASVAVQTFLRTVARVVGSEVIEDVVAFFRAFEGMEEGFRERAKVVGDLLEDPATAFVLVSSPRRDAMQEATFFAERLAEAGQTVEALVVNRVHPSFGDEAPAGLRAAAAALRIKQSEAQPSEAGARLAALYDNLSDFREIAILEREHIEALRDRIGPDTTLAYVPYLPHDVHDFATLHEVGELLFDTVSAR
ncbi:MAG TPA: ArsA-related P-loop ATPase [Acidimicrobiia bacterium]|nr:ArsA-related P-loop ATPase [Acidimicrobiia bacterium]